jgi:hypothetical protein
MKKSTTKADKFIDDVPELLYPCRMQFDDGSVAEVTGISVGLWQVTEFTKSLLANPLIVDTANFDADKVVNMAFSIAKSFNNKRMKVSK